MTVPLPLEAKVPNVVWRLTAAEDVPIALLPARVIPPLLATTVIALPEPEVMISPLAREIEPLHVYVLPLTDQLPPLQVGRVVVMLKLAAQTVTLEQSATTQTMILFISGPFITHGLPFCIANLRHQHFFANLIIGGEHLNKTHHNETSPQKCAQKSQQVPANQVFVDYYCCCF